MKRSLLVLFVLALSLRGFAQAQCAAFPCVVASVSLFDQTQSISNVPLYTPATNGIFRLSFYITSTPARNDTFSWGIGFGWTDSLKKRQNPLSSTRTGFYGMQPVLIVQDIAGQPLTYNLHADGNVEPSTYNLFITVEQLQ
jgi:hypothetical protein